MNPYAKSVKPGDVDLSYDTVQGNSWTKEKSSSGDSSQEEPPKVRVATK